METIQNTHPSDHSEHLGILLANTLAILRIPFKLPSNNS